MSLTLLQDIANNYLHFLRLGRIEIYLAGGILQFPPVSALEFHKWGTCKIHRGESHFPPIACLVQLWAPPPSFELSGGSSSAWELLQVLWWLA